MEEKVQALQTLLNTPHMGHNVVQPEEQIKAGASKYINQPSEKQIFMKKTCWHIIDTIVSSCLCIDGFCQTYHTWGNKLCCSLGIAARIPFMPIFYPAHCCIFFVLAIALYYMIYFGATIFFLAFTLPLNLFCCLGICLCLCMLPSMLFFLILPCNCLGCCVPGCGAFNLICPCSICLCPCFNVCLPLPCFPLDVLCCRCLNVCPCLPGLNLCCPLPLLNCLCPCTSPLFWCPFWSCGWCCTVFPFFCCGPCVFPCLVSKSCSFLDICWAPWCVLCCTKSKVFKQRALDLKMIQETKMFLSKMKMLQSKSGL